MWCTVSYDEFVALYTTHRNRVPWLDLMDATILEQRASLAFSSSVPHPCRDVMAQRIST